MTKLRKITSIILCTMIALTTAFMLLGCNGAEEDKKYDVAIRVGCSDGEVYEFPVGEYEKRIEIPYDGIARTFSVTKYWLKGYDYDGWIDIVSPMDNKFLTRCYELVEGNSYEQLYSIVEPGNYRVNIETDFEIKPLTDYTTWSLYITIQ